MHPLNKALAVFVVAFFVHTVLIQKARQGLTPEHLFALEKLQKSSWRYGLSILPFLALFATIKLFPIYIKAQLIIALTVCCILFVVEALRVRRNVEAAGLPAAFASKQFWATCILELGVAVAVVVVWPHISWGSHG